MGATPTATTVFLSSEKEHFLIIVVKVQLCTLIRAKRVVLEIVFDNLGVRHTDTDKSASLLSVSFWRSSHSLDPHCVRAKNYVFWTFLEGAFWLPPQKMQRCTASHASKGGQNGSTIYAFFSPLQNEHVKSFQTLSDGFCYLVIARSLLRSSSNIRSLVSVLALSKYRS